MTDMVVVQEDVTVVNVTDTHVNLHIGDVGATLILDVGVQGPAGPAGGTIIGTNNYSVTVLSSNGTQFKPGTLWTTVIYARVFYAGRDVTDEIDASRFKWTRVSPVQPPVTDAQWNTAHATGFKQVEVVAFYPYDKATYLCAILE